MRGPRSLFLLLISALGWSGGGCLQLRYVSQAGFGQLELYEKARPIADALRDPEVDLRTKMLLGEVARIKAFALSRGLQSKRNYEDYVDLERSQIVWFITASRPLAFAPKVWNFPIAGSFPYLGWFRYQAAVRFRDQLLRAGWEVYMRPVRAYSTGGWFRDPVLSTMLSEGDDAYRSLANVILHELVHANILVIDQSTYNESLASFVADAMTLEYLSERFGAGSAEVHAYQTMLDEAQTAGQRLYETYQELARVYESAASPAVKRARKRDLIDRLQRDFAFVQRPNNALLMGFRTYNAGQKELAQLFECASRSWPRFLAMAASLTSESFPQPQHEDIGPVIAALSGSSCGKHDRTADGSSKPSFRPSSQPLGRDRAPRPDLVGTAGRPTGLILGEKAAHEPLLHHVHLVGPGGQPHQ
jgi:predicted aminopeptidase